MGIFTWDGTWEKKSDSVYAFDVEYYVDFGTEKDHVQYSVNEVNAALCYDYRDTTFLDKTIYEKIEGDENFLPGKYMSFRRDIDTKDGVISQDTTYNYVTITEEGEALYESYTFSYYSYSESWTNEDLLSGKYIFIHLNSKTYLVKTEGTRYYKKE